MLERGEVNDERFGKTEDGRLDIEVRYTENAVPDRIERCW